MICPPCASAANEGVVMREYYADQGIRLAPASKHAPAICRDAALQPHGCTCQHGQRGQQPTSQETP